MERDFHYPKNSCHFSQRRWLIALDQALDPFQFFVAESGIPCEQDGIEPEFRFGIVALDVNVGRFSALSRIKEKPERAAAQNGWHIGRLRQQILALRNAAMPPRLADTA
jgi:hypothetical protein